MNPLSTYFIVVLFILLMISSIFAIWPVFGAPWIGDRIVSVDSPEERCEGGRLSQRALLGPTFREASIEQGIQTIRPYRYDMSLDQIKRAEEAQYFANLSCWTAYIDYWCNH